MAITISQNVTGIYPAYNDSYIIFTSGLASPLYAEITITGFANVFKIFPDASGVFVFNFKEAIKSVFNADGFKDANADGTGVNGKSIAGAYNTLTYDIEVFNISTSETDLANVLTFYKSVKQVGEEVFTNEAEVLHHSLNGVDFYLTYFEGYPFTVDLKRLTAADSLVIKNLNTNVSGTALVAASTNAYRLYIDKATENWTTTSYLPLVDVVNRLELKVNTVFKTNLNLKKVTGIEDCDKGLYLKWFNNHGGYSYWLFDEFYTTRIRSRENYQVATNDFSNVGALVNTVTSGGFSGEEMITAKSILDVNEAMTLKDLLTSPSVQMWSQREPWKAGEWIDVNVSGNYQIATKKALNPISVTVTLPELILPTL